MTRATEARFTGAELGMRTIQIQNSQVRGWIKEAYSPSELDELQQFLTGAGTFEFAAMSTGLFPAASLSAAAAAQTGYGNVWVRDNIYVAFALARCGREEMADRAVLALARFYQVYQAKFFELIDGKRDHLKPMNRPHIRFDGADLVENPQTWAHAQNDALGYFLWFYCLRALEGAFSPDFAIIEMFVLFFERIEFWRDADNGHWEERAKVEASSLGPIVAALLAVLALREKQSGGPPWRRGLNDARLDRLITIGRTELEKILPWECRGPTQILKRRYDSALLFLVYPLNVVTTAMSEQIFDDVATNLQGDFGIRRYLGDSYWTADYKQKLSAKQWTGDFSLTQTLRDRLAEPGEEAQWCLFDPIMSVIAGRRYLQTRAREDQERQIFYFNRSLGQLTGPDCPAGPFRCPEAYYLENGRYVANDHVPLLWTQANLLIAFAGMRETLGAAA